MGLATLTNGQHGQGGLIDMFLCCILDWHFASSGEWVLLLLQQTARSNACCQWCAGVSTIHGSLNLFFCTLWAFVLSAFPKVAALVVSSDIHLICPAYTISDFYFSFFCPYKEISWISTKYDFKVCLSWGVKYNRVEVCWFQFLDKLHTGIWVQGWKQCLRNYVFIES